MQFSRLLRNRGNGMELRSSDVVDHRGDRTRDPDTVYDA